MSVKADVAWVASVSGTEAAKALRTASRGALNELGRRVVSEAKRDIGKPVTVVSKESRGEKHVRMGKKSGPYAGRYITGSRPGEFPRKETAELQSSVKYSINVSGDGVDFWSADHGLWLELKESGDGGRKWISRTLERVLGSGIGGGGSGWFASGIASALRLFRAFWKR